MKELRVELRNLFKKHGFEIMHFEIRDHLKNGKYLIVDAELIRRG